MLAALAAILAAIAFFVLRPAGEPGVAMRDFEAYYAAGATWLAHGDPYSVAIWNAETNVPGVVAARREVLPFVGVPATLPLFGLLARMPYDRARLVWTALLAVSLAAVVAMCSRLLALNRTQTLLLSLAAFSFVPVTSDFVLGQAALPAYAFALVALVLPVAAMPLAILCSALQPNVALGLLVLLRSRRTISALFVAALLLVVCSTYASGMHWPAHYAATLAAHASAERFSAIQYTIAAILYGFALPQSASTVVSALIALAVIVIVVRRILATESIAAQFAVACCAVPFVAGFFHEHDFVVLFFPAVLAVFYSRLPALATLALVLVGVNWLDFAQQPHGAAQDIVLAAALLAASIGLRPHRAQIWAVAASAVCIGAGAWTGATHPLPIWPNDMAGVPTGSTIAALWKNEQLQTGLLLPDAAAALLRTLALLGSALLLYLNLDIDVHHTSVPAGKSVGMKVL